MSTFVIKSAGLFQLRVSLVWACLLGVFVAFVAAFHLQFSFVFDKLPSLLGFTLGPDDFIQGVPLTLLLCISAMAISVLLGLLSALGRMSGSALAFGLASFYTSFFRGTPLLLQILLIYLGLPQLGPVPAAIPSGIAALSLCYGAYLSEIFRSSIQSVARGQWEAAQSQGFSRWQILWEIILPQAIKVATPPVGAMFISMLKDSSLVSVMGLWEIMFLAQSYGRSSFRYMEMLLTAALIYWVLSIVLEVFQARLERRYRRSEN
jgi:polar amino acid transport system permease protein